MTTSVIALNPAEMQQAGRKMSEWALARIEQCKVDVGQCEATVDALAKNGIDYSKAQSLLSKARRRTVYYEKIKAAIDAGYFIVPSFWMNMFAVRTTRGRPYSNVSTNEKSRAIQTQERLPVGEGRFVSPEAKREWCDQREVKSHSGELVTKHYYENVDFREVEFPITMAKPEIIEATAKALRELIFDRIGIVQTQTDPIIVGEILNENKRPVTFFIAWWVDTKDI